MALNAEADMPSPAPVGTAIRWFAWIEEASTGTTWFRYRVRSPGEAQFRLMRDFSPQALWEWLPVDTDGIYEIEVTARIVETGEVSIVTHSYEVASRVIGETPVISPTANQLVFLYSAPPCPAGSRILVNFKGAGVRHATPARSCQEGRSVSFYLAGLRATTSYTAQHVVQDDQGRATASGPLLEFATGELPFTPPPTRSLQTPDASSEERVLLQNRLFDYSIATDLEGNVVWYIPEIIQYLTRPQPGGYFLAINENHDADDSGQRLRLIDLAGTTILETNAARINEQLERRGHNRMTSFHHEARRLPDGKVLVLAGTERFITDVQGPGEVAVIGDMILLLNAELEVEWVWDAFDHMDVSRQAILGQKCVPRGGGCPVMRIATVANDWLHGNSLAVTPDGGILYSARHQDWIVKIDFANGTGSGAVIWRLGKDGDFAVISDDPDPWFSHQHDASLVNGDSILLFDNGNTRYATDQNVHSRGQIFTIDEATRTARLTMNVDLGGYALALGSAQQLRGGRYHFNAGWLPNLSSQALEFNGAGRMLSQIEADTQQYRSFRMRDIYSPE
jgi:hypothetical protein